jgi:non-heme chloroperoxidase
MAYHVTKEGRRVYYEHYRGSNTPVFLIHGWGMSTHVWVDIIEALKAAGHEVLALDHRGCGRSDRDFSDLSIKAIADDVVAIAKACELRRVVLNTRAADFPFGGEREAVLGMGAAISAGRAAFFRGLVQNVCAKDIGQPALDWMWSIFMNTGPDVVKSLMDLADLDQRKLLSALSAPVLSIVGGKDVIIQPEVGIEAAKHAKNGEFVVFEDCGHAPFIEDAARYTKTLLGFLARL